MKRYAYDAVVLAGGAARRLGGEDKPGLLVGGTTLLDRVLAACEDARTTVVVGPERVTARAVAWVREEPPGGGPVAGLAAGLAAGPEAGLRGLTAEVTLLLAADLPFLDAATVHRLLDALAEDPGLDAAVLVDADGREQLLTAAYRTAALRDALAALGPPEGARLRAVTARLRTRHLPDTAEAAVDCDTWEDVERARDRASTGRAAHGTPHPG